MKVTISFFRHGESEANIVQHQMKCGDVRHLFMRDPTLTKSGIEKSIGSQQDAPQADIILSSQLLRAIQTGLWTYPKRFIHVIPYLNELGGGLDNLPHDKNGQKHLLGSDFYRVIFNDESSEGNFMIYLQKYILGRFKKDHVHISMFTHSRFMKKYLKMNINDLPNNIMIQKEYEISI
jgi:hypothetical protein